MVRIFRKLLFEEHYQVTVYHTDSKTYILIYCLAGRIQIDNQLIKSSDIFNSAISFSITFLSSSSRVYLDSLLHASI